ncbi:hypothetical protein HKBW3S06_00044 [Candidatus Hakubella thermalkaliphila]|uniref:YggT family protein n=1 Tax=Candidatus Hakubella thermalkaliphila TaxID=2754717 RepID=A0A6V8NL65_9ACTN|nr:YggT family protein [Candidatus Hakubella thermalkaliphila]GFP20817.1 hypothetical protein HKBW3S06_00044 [Candidatus Hakubella thermalkaliphila]
MNFSIGGVLELLIFVIKVYSFVIVARAILSWFSPGHRSLLGSIYSFLYDLTEPFLRIFRNLLSSVASLGGLDLSPLLALIFLMIISRLLNYIAYNYFP